MSVVEGDPKEHHGVVFEQASFAKCKDVELDEPSKQFVMNNPELVAKLTFLAGIPNLTDEQKSIVGRVEYELWAALEKMQPEKARKTVDCLSQWESYGMSPQDVDFTYEEVQTVRSACDESDFAEIIYEIMPGKDRRPPISPTKPLGEAVVTLPKYL